MLTTDTIAHLFEMELHEAGAGASRIISHIRSGTPFIMISAMRSNFDYKTNLQRTDLLRRALNALPVSFIETEGEYTEEGTDKPSRELSFFILPKKAMGAIPTDKFKMFGEKLMHRFDQDAIVFADGTEVNLLFNNGDTMNIGDTATFDPFIVQDLPGFSAIKGKKFSFTTNDVDPNGVGYGKAVNEKFDMKPTPKSKRGMFKGKTQEELRSQLSHVKAEMKSLEDAGKPVPKKLRSKFSELTFALRAKHDWGKA